MVLNSIDNPLDQSTKSTKITRLHTFSLSILDMIIGLTNMSLTRITIQMMPKPPKLVRLALTHCSLSLISCEWYEITAGYNSALIIHSKYMV